MAEKKVFKVIFVNSGEIYEIFAKGVSQSDIYGLLNVEELVFGERSKVVIDPSEERLQSEFSGVKRTFIPLHSIIRIDEVEKEGVGKIVETSFDKKGDKVAHFPNPAYSPPNS